jgi:hypothetical protein
MQKRTNPLELKVESKDYTPAPAAPKKETDAPVAQATEEQLHKTNVKEESIAEPTPVAAPIEKPAAAPVVQEAPAPVAARAAEPEKPAPAAAAPVEKAPKVEKAPDAAKSDQPAPTIAPDRVAPVRPGRPAPPRPVRHNAAENRVRHGENIADNDVSIAVKFRVTGDRVDRRMVLTRVSKDVCKLAQSLYPEQSLGSIIEGALLTRAFLQDRDAFDEMAREIIKKGGKIKC